MDKVAVLLDKSGRDRPGFVIIEGGTWRERYYIAEEVKTLAAQRYTTVVIELNRELVGVDVGTNQRDFKRVTDVIGQSITPYRSVTAHDESAQRIVVLIHKYERVSKIDDRLRYFLYVQYRNVAAWVLITQYALSASENVASSSQFSGYPADDWIDHICIVQNLTKLKLPRESRPIAIEPAISQSLFESQSPPTRVQIEAALRAREGQAKFRSDLLQIFGDRCAVTGCAVKPLLEAAHIEPYSEGQDHRLSNGLILRADIHTMFDKGLLAIGGGNPQRKQIVIGTSLHSDVTYRPLHLKHIDLPGEESEIRGEALKKHFRAFVENGGLD